TAADEKKTSAPADKASDTPVAPEAPAAAPAMSSDPFGAPAAPAAVPVPAQPQSHTVVSGDTLSRISRKYYGNSADWPKIAEANKAILPDPTKLKPGMVLTIPPK
ncbi:MAG: LysM peptidoglycan-binding domain-containing protein, partial [Chthoniobacterales bacterium]